jgi:hypothetical protein
MQRLLHTCAGVHIHPLQRQWRTVVHPAGRSQRGVPNLPRAASSGVCGNSKSGAMGSSRRRRPPCRPNWCAKRAGLWVQPRPVKRGVTRRRRQVCRRDCGLTGLARRAPRCVPTRSIAFSASGGSPGSYRPRRQSDRSSSQTQCECWCFTRTECYESRSRSSTFDGDGSRWPRVTARQSQQMAMIPSILAPATGRLQTTGAQFAIGRQKLRLQISPGMPDWSRPGGRVRFWELPGKSHPPQQSLYCAIAEPGLP